MNFERCSHLEFTRVFFCFPLYTLYCPINRTTPLSKVSVHHVEFIHVTNKQLVWNGFFNMFEVVHRILNAQKKKVLLYPTFLRFVKTPDTGHVSLSVFKRAS